MSLAINITIHLDRADIGIVFDTDVDRAALVDRDGKEINRNRLIALMAAIVLRKSPGSTIVTVSESDYSIFYLFLLVTQGCAGP